MKLLAEDRTEIEVRETMEDFTASDALIKDEFEYVDEARDNMLEVDITRDASSMDGSYFDIPMQEDEEEIDFDDIDFDEEDDDF